jgi:hypothetical protein
MASPKLSPTPRFHLVQVNYKVNATILVDTAGVHLDDTALVTVVVYYRPKLQSAAVVAKDQPTPASDVWSKVKDKLYFTPTLPGFYSIVLTAFTTDQSTNKAASIATFKIDHLTVVV